MLLDITQNLSAQVASDLHLPHWRHTQGRALHFAIEPKADILILAGDLCNGTPEIPDLHWLWTLSDLPDWHAGIFLVLGNHDHYGLNLDDAASAWNNALADTRIRVLNREVASVRGVRIAGCTLWTDFDRASPLVPFHAQATLSDYKHLYTQGRLARTDDILQSHYRDLNWLLDLPPGSPDHPLVIVTHHAPSWRSVQPNKVGDILNGAYVSALEWVAEQIRPTLWVHGHVHARFDYMLHESTRIVCNPIGYCGEQIIDARPKENRLAHEPVA